MPLSDDDVRHIAKLARLHLSDDQVRKFGSELGSILDYIDMLKEVETEGIEPTAQVTGQTNVFRDDEVHDDGASREELLGGSPLSIVDHQIQTPSAHG